LLIRVLGSALMRKSEAPVSAHLSLIQIQIISLRVRDYGPSQLADEDARRKRVFSRQDGRSSSQFLNIGGDGGKN
jgi:hypothetical protein